MSNEIVPKMGPKDAKHSEGGLDRVAKLAVPAAECLGAVRGFGVLDYCGVYEGVDMSESDPKLVLEHVEHSAGSLEKAQENCGHGPQRSGRVVQSFEDVESMVFDQ